jgi:acetyl esterase/lipase
MLLNLLDVAALIGALGSACMAALASLLIVFPAPSPRFAWWSIVASEGSLWIAVLSVLGVVLSLAVLAAGFGVAAWVGALLGVLALVVAIIPPAQAAVIARAHGSTISLHSDLFGRREEADATAPESVTFAMMDGHALMLDVYRPPAASGTPAVIVVHGGGWTAGDKGDLSHWSAWLAREGFAVFDIQYRLAPPATWQAAPGDVRCAIGWIKSRAQRYGVDPDRIAVLGRSAGAHLALLAAYTADDGGLSPSCEIGDLSVRAVVELYGATDLVRMLDRPPTHWLFDTPAHLGRLVGADRRFFLDRLALASPTTHVGPRTPPTLLVHGGRDQFIHPEQADVLADRLAAHGIPFETVSIPYAHHAFDAVWNGWSAQMLRPIVQRFLRAHTS